MSNVLPAEQDKLLKELNDIDAQERAGVLPERSNINLFLIMLVWVLGTFLAVLAITRNQSDLLYQILVLCIVLSFSLMGSFYNKRWGFYTSCVIALVVNGYVSYKYFDNTNEFVHLVDGITIFLFANQLGKRGYITASVLAAAKVAVLFYLKPGDRAIEDAISSIISMCLIGIIPVLMASISRASRRAKKQEVRAEILSLQNQDLIKSWGDFYQSGSVQQAAVTMPV
jgi:hypothetical protein